MMRRALLLCLLSTTALAAERWEPSNTFAVISGVLSWKDPSLTTFSARHRKDQELYDVLVQRGVPKQNLTLLLDSRATTSAILNALAATAERATPGATIVFYYAGHGLKAKDGKAYLASWDIAPNDPTRTGLDVDAVAERLSKTRPARVLLFADCCYSGALEGAARALRSRGIAATSLTSAEAANTSTGNWTFTQTLIDGLSGDPLADRDHDGSITLGEIASEVSDAMRCREYQRYGYSPGGDVAVAVARRDQPLPQAPGHPRGEYVLVDQGGDWKPARVFGAHNSDIEVELYDYSDKVDIAVAPAHVRAISSKVWPVGTMLEVTWGNRTWQAKVLKVDSGFHWITYPGWSNVWDEWVMADRIVGLWGAKKAEVEVVKKTVEVEWHGTWWPATVTRREGALYCIHYTGWGNEWDECVPRSRVR